MLRAIVTIIAMTLIVIFFGIPTLLIGLVYPARPVVAACSLIWARAILICSGVRMTVEGKEHLFDGVPRFFMGNHQSALDIPILMAAERRRAFPGQNTVSHTDLRLGHVSIWLRADSSRQRPDHAADA